MFESIALSKLQLSASNVRKVLSPEADLQLSHDIEARGLLQNLIVSKAKKRGHFDVIAGGRRLRAMTLIVERGAWTKDHEVSCLVINGDEATISETSLAENFQRMAMTPADECRAFQHFIGTDGSIDEVAKRFGQTRRFIEGRLRLAALAEPIFDALAEGKITLDLAKAYASTDNHEKQLRVFQTYGSGGYGYGNTADSIRRAIAQGGVSGKDPMALLVGEDAYVAAGGRIERDLFTDKADDTWSDPEILERLAGEKLETEAKRIAETSGLAWIRPIASTDTWSLRENLHRVTLPTAPLSEEALARIAEIEERQAAIEVEMEGESLSDDAFGEFETESERLAEEHETLSQATPILPPEWKDKVGQILKLSRDGEMVLEPTFYSETPLRLEADEEGNLVPAAPQAPTTGGSDNTPAKRPEAVAPGGKALSARLYDELAVQRRDILAANMLRDPGLALDYAIFAIVDGASSLGTTIGTRRLEDPNVGDLPVTKAREVLAEAQDALDSTWTEHECEVARFDAFRALDDDAKGAWIAYSVAISLQAKPTYDQRQNPMQNRLGQILEIDVAAWWRPTSANFFDGIQKGGLLQLLHDLGGPNLSSRYASAKKPEISVNCEKLCAGQAIVEDDVRDRALTWVPNAMRFLEAGSAGADPLDALGDDDEDDTAPLDGGVGEDGERDASLDGGVGEPGEGAADDELTARLEELEGEDGNDLDDGRESEFSETDGTQAAEHEQLAAA
ncbi:ParB family chromosome partitioning protein [Novosphingobium chloroacetimidivorans]|uniref:ParB family chromosome partitioning protein n=1 Tax=Novosphingobium chloroacetimidivorans TaxID=1428314 RepID=A0A7W7KAC8_9SPHN|nr:ParB/RepB/Spo0J family partition protein [Novosphingobium chloroacetimidivorans]MBB4859157.1 ParB family chromosome partitioning protein [Novosphingobium chloroacetimidivorans]